MGLIARMAGLYDRNRPLERRKGSFLAFVPSRPRDGAFGTIIVFPLVKGQLTYRPLSALFTMMAAGLGAFALETAKTQRRSS